MIEKSFLQNYAIKAETGFDNILREYVQNLFLRSFYANSASGSYLFKGGTALKLVFGSPRFSEDLDFTGVGDSVDYEKVLQESLLLLTKEGIKVDLTESKSTVGGYISIIKFSLWEREIEIMNQISFRRHKDSPAENVVVVSNVVPSYNAVILERSVIVAEKTNALIERAKPRDFFDFYYILRNMELKKYLKIGKDEWKRILTNLEKQDKKHLENELKRLLPKSFWPIIKNLPDALAKEMG